MRDAPTIQQERAMFSELFRIWRRVLLHPSRSTFEREADGASFDRLIIGMLIAAMLVGAGYFVSQATVFTVRAAEGLYGTGSTIWENTPLGLMRSAFVGFVIAPPVFLVGFFLMARMALGLARLVRTTTEDVDFTQHAYLLSLAVAPLALVASLVSVLPVVGLPAAFAVYVYALVPGALAIQAAHRLNFPLALIVWTVPVLTVTLLFTATYGALVALVLAMSAGRG